MSETSGNASMGSERNARTPVPTNSTVIRTRNSGWCSANATILWIMRATAGRYARQLRVRQRLEELLEEQTSRRDHMDTQLQSFRNRYQAVPLDADLNV